MRLFTGQRVSTLTDVWKGEIRVCEVVSTVEAGAFGTVRFGEGENERAFVNGDDCLPATEDVPLGTVVRTLHRETVRALWE